MLGCCSTCIDREFRADSISLNYDNPAELIKSQVSSVVSYRTTCNGLRRPTSGKIVEAHCFFFIYIKPIDLNLHVSEIMIIGFCVLKLAKKKERLNSLTMRIFLSVPR